MTRTVANRRSIVTTTSKMFLLLAALVAAALAASPTGAAASGLIRIDHYDDDADCIELLPDGTSFDGNTSNVDLDVLVLLDGPTLERGQAVMSVTAGSFRPMHITIRPTFQSISVPPTGMSPGPDGTDVPSIRSQQLIDASKAAVGGQRPQGVDLVYTITSKELSDAEGMADCIGGVRYPDLAFAVGEDYANQGEGDTGFLSGYKNATAKIAAHEIGHLMGAHHHYFNCLEGLGADDSTVCTLMSPYIDYQTLRFGMVEQNVIRGHAEDFARP